MQLGALYLEAGDLLVVLIALLAFAIIVLVCFANKAAHDEGYHEGYEKGYQDAVLDGLHIEDDRKAA
ncbi:MAG: hypothetical protein U0K14_03380 [Eggerthellaceae bacterium]|nr:hypothetical protein [Eggerthellaceae bacterium]